MNIRIPHDWLLEHLDTGASPQNIQEYLSLCGPSIERIQQIEGVPVYHIEVTTNRVDMMSVRGIAREAAAILPEFDLKARLIPLKVNRLDSKESLGITITDDRTLCHRILAVKLAAVKIGSSPPWMQRRLRQVGQRPLYNAIDITNYMMWEIGHPIHAFDIDRLTEKTIIVRVAKQGEELTTLDGNTRVLRGGEVVFDDGTGTIIDLPGIMGTMNTVVTAKSKNILLWIESIDAARIRKASMGLAIRSQAAVLNEKDVDPELGFEAIHRAVDLYQDIASAQVASKLIDLYPTPPKPKSLTLDQRLLETYMGLKIDAKKVKRILTNLGFSVSVAHDNARKSKISRPASDHGKYLVTPPSWRSSDMTISEDIIEEVARIYGYHKLPSVLMEGKLPLSGQGLEFHLEEKIKDHLADWGLTEVYTSSLVSNKLAELSGLSIGKHLKLSNPLSEDEVYLRRSIIPSHLEVLANNRQRKDLAIYELSNIYLPSQGNNLPKEVLHLVLTLPRTFGKAKAIADMLFERLRLRVEFLAQSKGSRLYQRGRTAVLTAGGKIIGRLGEVNGSLLRAFSLDGPITTLDIDASAAFTTRSPHPTYQRLPSYPPIIEDFTFIVPQKTYVGDLINEIQSTSRLVESVVLKERYRRHLTFSVTLRDPDRTLTGKEVMPVRKKIARHLTRNFQARLIGKVD